MAKTPSNHGSRWNRHDFTVIRKLVREGMPSPKIANALGRTLASLYMKASIEGISLGPQKQRLGKRRTPRMKKKTNRPSKA
jgi:hypothetical protein